MTEAIQMAVEAGKQGGDFGSHLVTQSNRVRPEYVQYARVAKKVDVRRLKEEMWKGMDIEVRPSH
jgi:condensin complex subunit 2